MKSAVIVDAVRTPAGRRKGRLSGIHPVDLASIPLQAVVERNDLDPGLVEDVICGCVSQTGEQGLNVARNAALAAGFPEEVVGVTVDRQCGVFPAGCPLRSSGSYGQRLRRGDRGPGVESMTRVPMGITAEQGPGLPFGPKMMQRYAHGTGPPRESPPR